jgi:hypothetical protein
MKKQEHFIKLPSIEDDLIGKIKGLYEVLAVPPVNQSARELKRQTISLASLRIWWRNNTLFILADASDNGTLTKIKEFFINIK